MNKTFKLEIKGPFDPKKLYLVSKEFCNEQKIGFSEAKKMLTEGTSLSFPSMEEAFAAADKYSRSDVSLHY
jgi:hypothetical protein